MNSSLLRKEYFKKLRASPEHKEYFKRLRSSQKYKEKHNARQRKRLENKEYRKEYNRKLRENRRNPEVKEKRKLKLSLPAERKKSIERRNKPERKIKSKIRTKINLQKEDFKEKRKIRRQKQSRREKDLKRLREKRIENPQFRLSKNISNEIYLSILKNKKGKHWENLVGYTIDELKTHIEKLWLPGMSWGNYIHSGWHIDHVIPKSLWKYSDPEDSEFKQCWSLCNLQPLWAKDNYRKGNKIIL